MKNIRPWGWGPHVFKLQRFEGGSQIFIFYKTNILSKSFMLNCGQCWCETFPHICA